MVIQSSQAHKSACMCPKKPHAEKQPAASSQLSSPQWSPSVLLPLSLSLPTTKTATRFSRLTPPSAKPRRRSLNNFHLFQICLDINDPAYRLCPRAAHSSVHLHLQRLSLRPTLAHSHLLPACQRRQRGFPLGLFFLLLPSHPTQPLRCHTSAHHEGHISSTSPALIRPARSVIRASEWLR